VRHFSPDTLRRFMRAHYTPDRMVVSAVGDIDFPRLVRLCEKYFASDRGNRRSATDSGASHSSPKLGEVAQRAGGVCPPFNATINKRTHQVHLLIGGAAPTLFDQQKTAFTLLNNIVGGPAMNSRLNVAVREKQGFCYTIESQYVPFTDAGLFYIYAGVDTGAADRSTELILDELRRLRDIPLTQQQLRAAQRQLIGQMAISNDLGLNEMQSIGKSFLNFDHVDTLDEMSRDILAVTADDLQAVARQYLAEESLSRLYYK